MGSKPKCDFCVILKSHAKKPKFWQKVGLTRNKTTLEVPPTLSRAIYSAAMLSTEEPLCK